MRGSHITNSYALTEGRLRLNRRVSVCTRNGVSTLAFPNGVWERVSEGTCCIGKYDK
jgi:hypothetical protein